MIEYLLDDDFIYPQYFDKFNNNFKELISGGTLNGSVLSLNLINGNTIDISGFTTTSNSGLSNQTYNFSTWSGDTVSGATRQAIANIVNSLSATTQGQIDAVSIKKYSQIVTKSDLSISGLTNSISLITLPAHSIVIATVIKNITSANTTGGLQYLWGNIGVGDRQRILNYESVLNLSPTAPYAQSDLSYSSNPNYMLNKSEAINFNIEAVGCNLDSTSNYSFTINIYYLQA